MPAKGPSILGFRAFSKKLYPFGLGGRRQRFFSVLASFSLSRRPLRACSFAQASPKHQNLSLPNGYNFSSNAPAY
jgi:hypothetical protein